MIRDWTETVAFVTGGASGLGLAMARRFAAAGARVMLADIHEATLDDAVRTLSDEGADVRGTLCDVSLAEDMERAARETEAAFGPAGLVCNNAGIARGGPADQLLDTDYRWIVDVNLMGVVNGARAFLPQLRAKGGGHIVNTASMAGFINLPGMAAYCMTKAAVVAFSDCLHAELAPEGIGVSVLCPGFVQTQLYDSDRARPERYGGGNGPTGQSEEVLAMTRDLVEGGISSDRVAERVIEGVERGDFLILTHPGYRPEVEQRFAAVLAAFGDWARRHPEDADTGPPDADPFTAFGQTPAE